MWIKICKTPSKTRGIRLKFQAARSFRCPTTRSPKCQILAHLATIGADELTTPQAQIRFWLAVESSLIVSSFSDSQKSAIREMVERHVNRPRLTTGSLPLMP
jgi:hypothetical protein